MRAVKGDKDTTITWVQCGLNPVDRVVVNGTTVYVSPTWPELKHLLLHVEEDIFDNLALPTVTKTATDLTYTFASEDGQYCKSTKLPLWEYTNATNCDNFNRNNPFTELAYFNAPNCTSAQNAFANNTSLKEITFDTRLNSTPIIFDLFCYNCNNLEKINGIIPIILSSDEVTAFAVKCNSFTNCYKLVGTYEVKLKNLFCTLLFNWTNSTAQKTGDLHLTITVMDDTINPWNYVSFDVAANNKNIKSLVINNLLLCGYYAVLQGLSAGMSNLEYIEIKASDRVWRFAGLTGYAASKPSLKKIKIINIPSTYDYSQDISILYFAYNSPKLSKVFTDKPLILTRYGNNAFDGALNITQVNIDFSHFKSTGTFANIFNKCKLDLSTVKAICIGEKSLPDTSTWTVLPSASFVLGISRCKLAKDTSEEIMADSFYAYESGVTKVDENDNIIYLKGNGEETINLSEADLNDGIIIETFSKIDISTVEDTSSITNWNEYYGYPQTISGVTYYATGELLLALVTLKNKGWNITVQYN